jgi:aromatic-L-amino-acid/L-tryptophan decarboxylase
MPQNPLPPEENLDPSDWDAMRALGHQMVDDMMNYLETVRERPVWKPVPEEVRQSLQAPLPTEEKPAEEVYAEFMENILPYPLGNVHPRFWGWVMGNGTPLGLLADMLAATMNPNGGGGNHVANKVEDQVIAWLKEIFGFPAEASGILVSGGSMADFIGLAVARYVKAGYDVRELGVGADPQSMTYYGSVEMHSAIQRGVEILGHGNQALRKIPVNDQYQIDLGILRQTIEADLKAEIYKPICLVGNAGTVSTGAIDPLDKLADIAAEYGMWFHVDGAFGALAAFSPEIRPLVAGIERADSLAFDLHKWGYLPFEVGCVLVRDGDAHRHTFSMHPDYLKHGERGPSSGENWYGDYGIQLTRGFRSLKVWMAFKTYGLDKVGRIIHQNVAQARYLAALVESSPELELMAPVGLNIVCFRYTAPGLDNDQLNTLNEELLFRLQESGVALPSNANLNGQYAIRCAITNHRSRREDFDLLAAEVKRLGKALVAEGFVMSQAH